MRAAVTIWRCLLQWFYGAKSPAPKSLTVVLTSFLVGCGSKPFIEVGAGYDAETMDFVLVDRNTGKLVPYDMDCAVGTASLGTEWPTGWRLEAYHQSCFSAGRAAEKVTNSIMVKKKFGGIHEN